MLYSKEYYEKNRDKLIEKSKDKQQVKKEHRKNYKESKNINDTLFFFEKSEIGMTKVPINTDKT